MGPPFSIASNDLLSRPNQGSIPGTSLSSNNPSTTGFGQWNNKKPAVNYTKGVCGLGNLGNTCFMNSAIQCLSNTPQLTEWFLAGKYKKDLNCDNPLGMKGEVAEAYGALVDKLWSGMFPSVMPREFKHTIGRFNPTFTGYMQHDSQELLAFLLDGLHEDLNRILKKPYVELPDFDNMSDNEIAECSWKYHKARNDSIIVDLFQGQFKSRLVCNECDKVSVTFDPFMYLSLPLPIEKKTKMKLVYVPYDPSERPQRLVVTLNKDASISHLRVEVAKLVNVEDPSTFLVVEIFSQKVYKIFAHYEPVTGISHSDVIYVYQLPGPIPSPPKLKPSSINSFKLQSLGTIRSLENGANTESVDGLKGLESLKSIAGQESVHSLEILENQKNLLKEAAVSDSPASQKSVTDAMSKCSTINSPPKPTLPVIRQGEGILIEWKLNKAQQIFGSTRTGESGVNADAWKDIEEREDPNIVHEKKATKTVTLGDCLDEFTKRELLGEEDLWYCPNCKKHQRATKKFDLWRMPDIMVVHLKRFNHSRTLRDKIDALIDFPTEGLDLTDRVLDLDANQVGPNERLLYDLYAVDNHFGGLGGGHYTAYAQNEKDHLWYNFDDSHASKVQVGQVKTSAAYLLFYKRRRNKPEEAPELATSEKVKDAAIEVVKSADKEIANKNTVEQTTPPSGAQSEIVDKTLSPVKENQVPKESVQLDQDEKQNMKNEHLEDLSNSNLDSTQKASGTIITSEIK
ncbi:hypothetical protein PHYBLDRAFT_129255 [Phycomyces blakesleeanus NRRL 1555(-)]|uniref:Ubiquitin carboxyl-terminal hydrolase n=1 Tax=Phycomyces blakesleeanus (strain ATCC 8743b / DSM 1359 / FGSC 10004 / NBRC 33097 / NRRL 1555) TaxID=763407 RepID=A0A162Q6R5_PHYB8|nr:hypothetical protein PHYBLDRAFT_129255 [Phycomyces blakesleeanus NRRL 1555(-)]OAD80586.1 hypothetical protein PHYBLDRAFT_129255 [Phycomyces blakesleeanus NRRL 1555(-)]|eukprot:XP_018298626.1 hypothetical protein PHYBLDRAFT_129255 [Phycomyces blakesleeanus NRRL 1555(-)]